MLHASPAFLAPTPRSALLASATPALSPAHIRQTIADWVAQNKLNEADALSRKALQEFPDSEDILVMRALVSQVRLDWSAASSALEQLVALQGRATPAVTWSQWVRVLRCAGDDARAMTVAAQGLAAHPHHPGLQEEFNALQHLGIQPALRLD
jgi:hypothetical protein